MSMVAFCCARCFMRLQFLFLLLFAPAVFAQTAAPDHDMSQMQHAHGGFLKGGMEDERVKGVILNAQHAATTHTTTLPVGPMNLPGKTSPLKMPPPPDLG